MKRIFSIIVIFLLCGKIGVGAEELPKSIYALIGYYNEFGRGIE